MIPNKTSCPNCGLEQSRFNSECKKCGYFLRDKVANIDLGSTLSGLVDEPGETFDKIIYAENKNFSSFFLIFAMIKLYFIAIFFNADLTWNKPAGCFEHDNAHVDQQGFC